MPRARAARAWPYSCIRTQTNTAAARATVVAAAGTPASRLVAKTAANRRRIDQCR
jgi:hypothetical protein